MHSYIHAHSELNKVEINLYTLLMYRTCVYPLTSVYVSADAVLMLSDASQKREFITVQREPKKEGGQGGEVTEELKEARVAAMQEGQAVGARRPTPWLASQL